jgi:hypothetical protein
MSLRYPPIRSQIKKEHEEAIDEHVVCYLTTRVRVMYAKPFKECPIECERRFFKKHV